MAEETVSIYDPVADAYRRVPLSVAEKFVERMEETKERVAKAKNEAVEKKEFKEFKKAKAQK